MSLTAQFAGQLGSLAIFSQNIRTADLRAKGYYRSDFDSAFSLLSDKKT